MLMVPGQNTSLSTYKPASSLLRSHQDECNQPVPILNEEKQNNLSSHIPLEEDINQKGTATKAGKYIRYRPCIIYCCHFSY